MFPSLVGRFFFFFFSKILINLFIFILQCSGSSLLCGLFSGCSAQFSLVAEHVLYGRRASVAAACGRSSCGFQAQ